MSKHTIGSLAQAPAHFQHGHQTGHGTCEAVHKVYILFKYIVSALAAWLNDGVWQLQARTAGVE